MKKYKIALFFGLILGVINSCGNATRANAEISTERTNVFVDEEVIVSAKYSKYSSISWYLDNVLETRCSQKTSCLFIFEEAGEFTVSITVTVDPPTFPLILPIPTQDTANIKFIVDIAE